MATNPKRWRGKTEFTRLSGSLAVKDGLDFQRALVPLLAVIAENPLETPAMKSLDRQGIDHIVWSDGLPHPLVVQAKGFKVSADELGARQVEQCRRSIDAFKRSGIKAETYLLIHNRDGRRAEFREPVQALLDDLQRSGQVSRAELWGREELLQSVFEAMHDRALVVLEQYRGPEWPMSRAVPLERVPFRVSTLKVTQFSLAPVSAPETVVGDPVDVLLEAREGSVSVLLGEFGSGKTTTAARAMQRVGAHVVFIDAGRITKQAVGTKDVLSLANEADEVLAAFRDEDRPVLGPIVRPVFEKILMNPDSPVVLLIDGLDESVFLTRTRGLGVLLEMLRLVRVPVVLTARTEFWTLLQADFVQFVESYSGDEITRPSPIDTRLAELLPWGEDEMIALIDRVIESIDSSEGRARLTAFKTTVSTHQYVEYYGDIPRRPLFLGFILDDVVVNGIQPRGRARLIDEWARRKVARDIAAPTGPGREGRIGIAPDVSSVGATIDLAYRAMMKAALAMTERLGKVVDLLPTCTFESVTAGDPQLEASADAVGLALNSLLLPTEPRRPGQALNMRFAHRAFQEFFLAMAVALDPDALSDASLPTEVDSWVRAIEREGLVAPA
jgi:hypothetical protein